MFKKWKILALSPIFFLVHNIAYADNIDSVLIQYPENEAVTLSMGWNLHKDKSVTNVCIQNFEKYSVDKNLKEEFFKQGNNSWSLKTHLDLSYKQSVTMDEKASALGGKESEDTKESESSNYKLAASYDMSRQNRYLLGKQNIVTRWDAIKSQHGLIQLTPEAADLYWKDRNQFFAQCGHGYIARIEYGGTFYSLYKMGKATYNATLDLKTKIENTTSAKVKADEGVAKEDGKVTTDTTKKAHISAQTDINNEQVEIEVSESGGSASKAGTDFDSVMEQYFSFPLRVEKAPTEYKMAIFPYPPPPKPHTSKEETAVVILGEIQAPYMILSREYGKWQYLERLIGKMIAAKHSKDKKGYLYIDGITANQQHLEELQDMAQAKLDIINKVSIACMSYIGANKHPNQKIIEKKCSLNGKTVSYTTWNKKDKKDETYTVAVAESDIYYLPKLPLSHNIFDGKLNDTNDTELMASYKDLIFNQVNGIYRERCGNNYIKHFCENESKVEQAVNEFVPDVKGYVYYKYKSFQGDGLCAKAEDWVRIRNCDSASLFAVDHKNKQVRVRHINNTSNNTNGCLKWQSLNDNLRYLKIEPCLHDANKNAAAQHIYWNLIKYRGDGLNPYRILKDTYTDTCADVKNNIRSDGTDIITYPCQETYSHFWNQKWKQFEPVFHLD